MQNVVICLSLLLVVDGLLIIFDLYQAFAQIFRYLKFNDFIVLHYMRFSITFSLFNINVIANCTGNLIN